MADFGHEFGIVSPYVGSGGSFDYGFVSYWPPEAGCIGLSISGSGTVSTVVATVTTLARELLARAVTDGTSFQVTHFAVGTSGYDTANPLSAIAVDPDDTSLASEVFRDTIDQVETATLTGTAKSFVGRIARDELSAGIGEVGLIATILSSPFPAEIGSEFLFALAHRPLDVKTDSDVVSYRIIVAL